MRLSDAIADAALWRITGNRHRALRDYGWVLLQAGQPARRCQLRARAAGAPRSPARAIRWCQTNAPRPGAGSQRRPPATAPAPAAADTALRWAESPRAGGDALGLQRIRAERDMPFARRLMVTSPISSGDGGPSAGPSHGEPGMTRTDAAPSPPPPPPATVLAGGSAWPSPAGARSWPARPRSTSKARPR